MCFCVPGIRPAPEHDPGGCGGDGDNGGDRRGDVRGAVQGTSPG